MGYNRDNFKYKESFEKSLTKVNQQTKKVLEDILQSTKTVSRVVSTIGVQRMDEISLKSMLKKLVSPFKKLFSRLKINNKSIDGFEWGIEEDGWLVFSYFIRVILILYIIIRESYIFLIVPCFIQITIYIYHSFQNEFLYISI